MIFLAQNMERKLDQWQKERYGSSGSETSRRVWCALPSVLAFVRVWFLCWIGLLGFDRMISPLSNSPVAL